MTPGSDNGFRALAETAQGAIVEVAGRNRAEVRLAKINECFLGFGSDPKENINRLTAVCGELLGAACALYNRIDQGMLCSWGQWNTPPGYNPVDRPEGHICYDVIRRNRDDALVIRNLPATHYAATDPNVVPYGLRTYIGLRVRTGGGEDGSLCLVYQNDFIPTEDDLRTMGAIASAIGVEEKRRRTEKALLESEERLRQSQKTEAVGRLAGGIAHDFNNLLMVINGYGAMLLSKFAEGDPLRKDVEEILKAGERAAKLTLQLLAYSRRQVFRMKVLDLNEVVSDTETMLRRLIGEDVELVTILDPGLWRVKADPGQIEQVIMNLAVNARDAMSGGGKLTIETANGKLDGAVLYEGGAEVSGLFTVLSISDTGCGMDAETLGHIFEPFFTTKEIGKGTGLGLSTVYGIVKQSEGHVAVSSEPGSGTTFRIYLPSFPEASDNAVQCAEASDASAGHETLLLVEDEEIVRHLVREVLRKAGYTVLEASCGEDALSLASRHASPIHLLVTDVVMPNMSGRELAEHLSARRPEMKVLYMSGYTADAVVHHGVRNSEAAFLQKPYTPSALLRKVRESLGRAT